MAKVIDSFIGEYSFLSNFHPVVLRWNGTYWKSAEHAFNAAKTTDSIEQMRVQQASSPRDAKQAGRKVALRPDWDKHWRYVFMLDVVRAKFKHPQMQRKLIETGDAILVEGNTWHDNVWGVCRCDKCAASGKNHLGITLMQVRYDINQGLTHWQV